MAETNQSKDQSKTIEIEEERLKYLEFVQAAALCTLIYASKVYDYAKENSGPLKSSVQTVEGTVKTVVGLVYEKYHDVPVELLKFVDCKFAYLHLACRRGSAEIVESILEYKEANVDVLDKDGDPPIVIAFTSGLGRAPVVSISYLFWFCDTDVSTVFWYFALHL